jgi:hypothetical protein
MVGIKSADNFSYVQLFKHPVVKPDELRRNLRNRQTVKERAVCGARSTECDTTHMSFTLA